MIRLMRNEWQKIKWAVLGTILLISLLTCILTGTLYQNYTLHYGLDVWEIGTEIVGLLFPLFVVIPVCWNMYYERKDNFLLYTMPRVNTRKYLVAKWMTSLISAFLILFIPYFLSAIVALCIKIPMEKFIPENAYVTPFSHIFLDMFTQKPLLYSFLLSCWKGFIGGIVMSFGFTLSLYIDNIFVILTGPFIYTILENFILSFVGLPQYRLVTAFDPTTIASEAITIGTFFVSLVLICAVIIFIYIYFGKIKRVSIFKV